MWQPQLQPGPTAPPQSTAPYSAPYTADASHYAPGYLPPILNVGGGAYSSGYTVLQPQGDAPAPHYAPSAHTVQQPSHAPPAGANPYYAPGYEHLQPVGDLPTGPYTTSSYTAAQQQHYHHQQQLAPTTSTAVSDVVSRARALAAATRERDRLMAQRGSAYHLAVPQEDGDTAAEAAAQGGEDNVRGEGEKEGEGGGGERQLPEGWQTVVSRSTGEVYYWNPATGESTYDFPPAAAGSRPAEADTQLTDHGLLSDASRAFLMKREAAVHGVTEEGTPLREAGADDSSRGGAGGELFRNYVAKVKQSSTAKVSNLARSALFVDEATSDQYLVYSGGANGALQFYKDPMHLSKPPRKVIVADRIKEVRWAGLTISTPMGTFKLRGPKSVSDTDAGPRGAHANVTQLFRHMHAFWEEKQHGERVERPAHDGELNAMAVGTLLGGRVLYQPRHGMRPEGCEQDVLRLSVALALVKKQLVKNKIQFSGTLTKSSTSTKGKVAKTMGTWDVRVEAGVLNFRKPGESKLSYTLDMDIVTGFAIDMVTIVMDYGEITLTNSSLAPEALDRLVPALTDEVERVREESQQAGTIQGADGVGDFASSHVEYEPTYIDGGISI